MSTPISLDALREIITPFVCPVKGCGAGFTSLNAKKNHVRSEHIGTKKAKR